MTSTKDLAKYEDRLLKNRELLEPQDDLEKNWTRKYGTEDKKIAKHRKARQEVIRDQIADQLHHSRFASCVENIENVELDSSTAYIEITKWKAAAELHLKAMGKYLPDVKSVELSVTPETQAVAEGVSRAAEIIGRLAGARIQQDDAGAVPGGSVVSTQVRDEEEGS